MVRFSLNGIECSALYGTVTHVLYLQYIAWALGVPLGSLQVWVFSLRVSEPLSVSSCHWQSQKDTIALFSTILYYCIVLRCSLRCKVALQTS